MRPPRLAAALLATLLPAAACHDATSPAAPPLSSPAAIAAALPGTYTLRGINGAAPPQAVQVSAGDTVTMLGATLAFAQEGTYRWKASVRHSSTPSASSADSSSGTWTVSGSQIAISATSGPVTGATTLTLGTDGALTMDDAVNGRHLTLVFRP